jgi:hypothetical protein
MIPSVLFAGALSLLTQAPATSRDSSPAAALLVGAFIDFYYAYDFGRPKARDRAFTTQAVRHNEMSLNLAYASLSVERERVRGRLAFQAGTSVNSNYAGEPSVGANSGAVLIRHVQEATAGLRLVRGLWFDAGIYLS